MKKHNKRSNGLVGEVLRRLKEKAPPVRTKRTLVLTKTSYDEFEGLCRNINRYPSEVVDEFIKLFNSQQGKS